MGTPVTLLHGAADRHLRMLETTLAIPQILYEQSIEEDEFERIVATVTKDLLSSTCASEILFGETANPPATSSVHHSEPAM